MADEEYPIFPHVPLYCAPRPLFPDRSPMGSRDLGSYHRTLGRFDPGDSFFSNRLPVPLPRRTERVRVPRRQHPFSRLDAAPNDDQHDAPPRRWGAHQPGCRAAHQH